MAETRIKGVWLHRRAETALDAFPPEEREKVEWALGLLGDPAARDFVTANSSRLPIPEGTVVFRATPEVRILFEEGPDGDGSACGSEPLAATRVLDVVRADALKNFATSEPRERADRVRTRQGGVPSRRGLEKKVGGPR